mgnify:FL=1
MEMDVKWVVTAVERRRNEQHRYDIYLNGEYALTVHEDVLVEHRLVKGAAIDRKRYAEIVRDEQKHRSWSDAMRYVGRKPRTEQEVRRYLRRRGYEPSLVEQAIERLRQRRYVDDEQFAAEWSERRILSHKKGRRWVQAELSQKGVDKTIIMRALEQIDPEDELEAAAELGRKKWWQASGELADKRRKTAAFLLRRGFAGSLVREAVRRIERAERETSESDAERSERE